MSMAQGAKPIKQDIVVDALKRDTVLKNILRSVNSGNMTASGILNRLVSDGESKLKHQLNEGIRIMAEKLLKEEIKKTQIIITGLGANY